MCRDCANTGQIVRQLRPHYVHDGDSGGTRLEIGPVVDACPTCAAEAEAEWMVLTLAPLQRSYAAE